MMSDFKLGIGVDFLTSNEDLQRQLNRYAKNLKVDATIGVDFTKAQAEAKEAASEIQKILQKAYKGITGKELSDADAKRYATKYLKEYINMTNQAYASSRKLISETARLAKAESWQKWADNNTKAGKKYGAEIDLLISKMKDLNVSMTKAESNDLQTRWNQIKSGARTDGLLGKTSTDKLKNAWEKFGGWSLATGSLMQGVTKIKDAVSELKDVDDLLTGISKTSGRTKEELKSLENESFDRASKFGRTATDWLTGVQEMNRSGFYGEQGNALADTSALAQSAGDMTAEVANNWILATNSAYKYQAQAEKLNAVLDGTNEITNRNSVNMTDIANAMTTVGSNAANAGVQVNELSALIGTAVATTKKEGNEVGTAFKSIFVNLQNTSSSKIQATLEKAGTSMTEIVNGTEQLRSPIAILKDLAKTYNELDQKDPLRSEITRNIGGKVYHVA